MRRKGAKQRDRDRTRAALHRASLLEAAASAAAPETVHHAPQTPLPLSILVSRTLQNTILQVPPLPVPDTHRGEDDPVPPHNVDEESVDQSDSDEDDDDLSNVYLSSCVYPLDPSPAQ